MRKPIIALTCLLMLATAGHVLCNGTIILLQAPVTHGGSAPPSEGWDDPLTNNLVGSWQCDNDAGYVQDESVFNNDGFIDPPLPFDYAEGAITFGAADSYIISDTLVGFDAITNGFTIVAWVKRNNNDAAEGIYEKANAAASAKDISFTFGSAGTGTIVSRIHSAGSSSVYIGRSAPDFNAAHGWVQVMLDWDGSAASSGINIYTNTVAVDNADGNAGSFSKLNNTATALSKIGTFGAFELDGYIQHVRVYGRVLTTNEHATLFAANRTNEVIDTISTNSLLEYKRMVKDDNLRSYVATANAAGAYAWPVQPSGPVLSIVKTNTTVGVNFGRVDYGFDFTAASSQGFRVTPMPAAMLPTNAITLSAWFNVDDKTQGTMIRANDSYVLDLTGGLRFYAYGPDKGITYAATNFATNVWYQATATYDRTNMFLYLDGVQVATDTDTNAIAAATTELGIGAVFTAGVPSGEIDGVLDVIRIYDIALSSNEVGVLYQKTLIRDENGYDFSTNDE